MRDSGRSRTKLPRMLRSAQARRYNRCFAAPQFMSTLYLYLACVLIWGSTWIAITYQLGVVPAEVSVAYRFGLGALILFAWSLLRRKPLKYGWPEHRLFMLSGALMFGTNYVLVYYSEMFVSSGLVAVLFSTMVFANLFFAKLFFGTPLRREVAAGAVLGVAGIVLIFWPEIARFSHGGDAVYGLVLGMFSVLAASVGNMVMVQNQNRGVPVVQANAFSMLYGASAVFVFALLKGSPIVFNASTGYVVSLLYLSVFGSVLAFGAYMTLVGRIGPGPAGYTSVAIPVVALLISTVAESFQWHWMTFLGLVLCIGGNVLVLRMDRVKSPVIKPGVEPSRG
jgi:drug/metabolite transporter (DMT)-like permease